MIMSRANNTFVGVALSCVLATTLSVNATAQAGIAGLGIGLMFVPNQAIEPGRERAYQPAGVTLIGSSILVLYLGTHLFDKVSPMLALALGMILFTALYYATHAIDRI